MKYVRNILLTASTYWELHLVLMSIRKQSLIMISIHKNFFLFKYSCSLYKMHLTECGMIDVTNMFGEWYLSCLKNKASSRQTVNSITKIKLTLWGAGDVIFCSFMCPLNSFTDVSFITVKITKQAEIYGSLQGQSSSEKTIKTTQSSSSMVIFVASIFPVCVCFCAFFLVCDVRINHYIYLNSYSYST